MTATGFRQGSRSYVAYALRREAITATGCGRLNLARAQIGDADHVLELLWLLFTTVGAAARPHQDLVLDNPPLRHQRVVLNAPT